MGNELCGDDAAGPAIAKKLQGKVPWTVYDTQTVPESFLMKIVGQKPTSVVLIDALDFGGEIGNVELVSADKINGQGPSTHGPAPLAFLEVLQMMHPCKCFVLGIQPKSGQFGEPMSDPVKAAVDMVTDAFKNLAAKSGE